MKLLFSVLPHAKESDTVWRIWIFTGISVLAYSPGTTAEWTAQQLRDAFPWDSAPRYLLRNRDRVFGDNFSKQVQDMAIQKVLSAPRSPWQRAYVERVIGTIRREHLDHVIVFNQASPVQACEVVYDLLSRIQNAPLIG